MMQEAALKNQQVESTASRLKQRVKRSLRGRPMLWSAYWRTKQQIRRILLLRYFLHDLRMTYAWMFWRDGHAERITLSSELLFQYHKIEKGLVMPGARRMFGVEPAQACLDLCRRWLAASYPREDPIFVGAVETLVSYETRLRTAQLDPENLVLSTVQAFLGEMTVRDAALSTPMPFQARPGLPFDDQKFSFSELAVLRRSVRDFKLDAVPKHVLMQAAKDAQLSPSACNRQPCRIRIVSESDSKCRLLALQNGNRGFGHLVPHIAIVTADERCFFDASERHEPYIDGGLFAMSFILSLSDQGVGTCCLNWCVPPRTDRAAHILLDIPSAERIIMLVAIGYANNDCNVPRSARRDASDVIEFFD